MREWVWLTREWFFFYNKHINIDINTYVFILALYNIMECYHGGVFYPSACPYGSNNIRLISSTASPSYSLPLYYAERIDSYHIIIILIVFKSSSTECHITKLVPRRDYLSMQLSHPLLFPRVHRLFLLNFLWRMKAHRLGLEIQKSM